MHALWTMHVLWTMHMPLKRIRAGGDFALVRPARCVSLECVACQKCHYRGLPNRYTYSSVASLIAKPATEETKRAQAHKRSKPSKQSVQKRFAQQN